MLHSRTDFEDHEDAATLRRILRLWLKMPNAIELAPEFPGRNAFPKPSNRRLAKPPETLIFLGWQLKAPGHKLTQSIGSTKDASRRIAATVNPVMQVI